MHTTAASRAAQRHLRALVSRLRGCLTALTPQQQHLLRLRAGLDGAPSGPAATARILHIGAQREALLERVSLVALRSAAESGCAGPASSSSPTLTSTATAAGVGGQLVSSVSYLPNASTPAPSAAAHSGSGSGKARTGSGSPAATGSPSSPGKPPALGTTGIQRAAVTSSESPALALVVLMLLLGTVVLLRPWRRRSPIAYGATADPVAPMAAATAAPARPATRTTPPRSDAPSSRSAATPAPAPVQKSTWIPAAARAPKAAAAPAAAPGPKAAAAPAAPRPTAAPAPAPAPAAAPPAQSPQRRREPGWLRDHAAQGALLATAVAGVLARGLARRSRPGRRR
jgi:hypothetical protein